MSRRTAAASRVVVPGPVRLSLIAVLCGCGDGGEERAAQRLVDASCEAPALDAEGTRAVFLTRARLDPSDRDELTDVYWLDSSGAAPLLVSRGLDGGSADGPCLEPTLGADGHTVAFVSFATNLTPARAERDGMADVFVARLEVEPRSRAHSAPRRIEHLVEASSPARDQDGWGPNGHSFGPSLSADGTRVAFWTSADNLVAGDGNGEVADVLVVDLALGAEEPIAGRLLVSRHAYRPELAGPASGASQWPCLSADGARLAFTSRAWNLVDEDPNAGLPDVFVADLGGRGTDLRLADLTRVIAPGEASGDPAWRAAGRACLDGDGSRVAFEVRAMAGRGEEQAGSIEIATFAGGAYRAAGLAAWALEVLPEARRPLLSAAGDILVVAAQPIQGPRGLFVARIVEEAGVLSLSHVTAVSPLGLQATEAALAAGGGRLAFTAAAGRGALSGSGRQVLRRILP